MADLFNRHERFTFESREHFEQVINEFMEENEDREDIYELEDETYNTGENFLVSIATHNTGGSPNLDNQFFISWLKKKYYETEEEESEGNKSDSSTREDY